MSDFFCKSEMHAPPFGAGKIPTISLIQIQKVYLLRRLEGFYYDRNHQNLAAKFVQSHPNGSIKS